MRKILVGFVLFLLAIALSGYLAIYLTERKDRPKPTPAPNPAGRTVADEFEKLPPGTGTPVQTVPQPPDGTPNIVVETPADRSTVSLPFTVSGIARVFESTVNIEVRAAGGTLLYAGIATATAPDAGLFGSFTHTITYFNKRPGAGELALDVLWYSPRDGSPLDRVRRTLAFEESGTREIKVYFSNPGRATGTCEEVFPVERLIRLGESRAASAVELLLLGPTAEEKNAGYETAFTEGLALPRIAIAQGTATVDFGSDLALDASDACRAKTIRAQISRTLYQFTSISEVIINIPENKP